MTWEKIVKRQSPDVNANRQFITKVADFRRKQAGKPFDLEAYEAMVRHGNATFKFGTTGRTSGMYMPDSQTSDELERLQRDIDAYRKGD